MAVPHDIEGQIGQLYHKYGELSRRLQNQERTGTVVRTDYENKIYRVKLLDDDGTGNPYLTPWIPMREAAAGENQTHMPVSLGEQVALVSQSGDLRDAEITHSLASDENPTPSNRGDEYILSKVGKATVKVTDGGDKVIFECGKSRMTLTDGSTILATPKFHGIQT